MTRQRIDFARKPGPPRKGWVSLVLGTVALASTLALAQHWTEEARSVQQALDQTERDAQNQLAAARAATKLTPAETRRWAQWRMQQVWPWQEALLAVDAASSAPVYILGLTWQAGSDGHPGQIKMEAEAPNWHEALAFIDRLRHTLAQPDPPLFGQAQLTSQQQAVDAGTNASVQRFVVTVPLRSPAGLLTATHLARPKP